MDTVARVWKMQNKWEDRIKEKEEEREEEGEERKRWTSREGRRKKEE